MRWFSFFAGLVGQLIMPSTPGLATCDRMLEINLEDRERLVEKIRRDLLRSNPATGELNCVRT